MLYALFLVGSFVAALASIPMASVLARRIGLLDRPDGRRKIHTHPIPLAGGIGIFMAISATLAVGVSVSSQAAREFVSQLPFMVGLGLAALLLLLVGVLDDRSNLRARYKFIGQLCSVGIVVAAGMRIESIDLFGASIELGVLAIPFTVFWLLGAINSLNLIDGMDGMVGCVGAVTALSIAAMALVLGQMAVALIAFALAGALIAFLCFNLPPAKVFMGDSGSMLIGLLVGVLALRSSLKGPATVMLTLPIAVLALPIFDTAAAILRRTLTGRSIATTDRGHLHHCLQRSGLSRLRVLCLVTFLTMLAGLGAVASLALHQQALAVGSILAVFGILLVTRLFGHAELLLAKKQLSLLLVRIRRGSQGQGAHETSVQLQGSADWDQIWQTLIETANQLNLHSVRLDVNLPALHEGFHARWDRLTSLPEDAQVWRIDIPMAYQERTFGRIEIVGVKDRDAMWEKVSILSKVAEDIEQTVLSLNDRRHPSPISTAAQPSVVSLSGPLHMAS